MSRSTTPVQFTPAAKASTSRPSSRPATPLRRSSRGSLHGKPADEVFPLNTLAPAFAELSDAMATLEADMGDMQIMHDSLSRFNENFASFLYGLNMNAFCMDFGEAPARESFRRAAEHEAALGSHSAYEPDQWRQDFDGDATFMTTDTSFVREPVRNASPTLHKTPSHRGAPAGRETRGGRGGAARGTARGGRLRYSK